MALERLHVFRNIKPGALAFSYTAIPGEKNPDEVVTTTIALRLVRSSSLSSTFRLRHQTATPTITTASSSQTTGPVETHSKLSSGAIAGIAVDRVFSAILLSAFLFLPGCQTTTSQLMRRQRHSTPMHNPV